MFTSNVKNRSGVGKCFYISEAGFFFLPPKMSMFYFGFVLCDD